MNNADDKPKVGRDWTVFVVVWIPYSLLIYRFWHNIDDAFISFRYAKNWAMGYGLRYNVGPQQPEEGYSNFLWVAVCTFVEYLELDITFWAPMLGFACGSLLLYLVFRTLRLDFSMELGVAFSITLSLGLFPPYALWSTGGMATMAFALSAFATAYFLVLRSAGIAPYRGALAGVAMALLRTEGIAWALLFALLGIVIRRMRGEAVWRPMAVSIASVGTAFSVYFAWQYSYYQLLFPNPVYAKVGFSPEVSLRGFRYVATFALTFVTPLFFVVGGWLRGLAGSTEAGSACPWDLEPRIPRLCCGGRRGLDGHGTVSDPRTRLRSALDGMVGGSAVGTTDVAPCGLGGSDNNYHGGSASCMERASGTRVGAPRLSFPLLWMLRISHRVRYVEE